MSLWYRTVVNVGEEPVKVKGTVRGYTCPARKGKTRARDTLSGVFTLAPGERLMFERVDGWPPEVRRVKDAWHVLELA